MTKRITYLSPEEFTQLLTAVKKKKDKILETAIILGYGSGLRISEIIGFKRKNDTEIYPLTKDNIDLVKHQIRIDDAKGGKWRIAPTGPALKPEHLKLLPLQIKRRTLQNRFYQLTEKTLNKKLSFHVLRHGFGNYCVNVLKLPMPMVQQYMGHSSVAITGIYAKANPEESINAYWRALDEQK